MSYLITLEFREEQKEGSVRVYSVFRSSFWLGLIKAFEDGSVIFCPGVWDMEAVELINIAAKMDDIKHGW